MNRAAVKWKPPKGGKVVIVCSNWEEIMEACDELYNAGARRLVIEPERVWRENSGTEKWTPFKRRIFYGASNRDNTGPSDEARREVLRQIRHLMSVDSGLEQLGMALHESSDSVKAERAKIAAERRKLVRSIRTGLGL